MFIYNHQNPHLMSNCALYLAALCLTWFGVLDDPKAGCRVEDNCQLGDRRVDVADVDIIAGQGGTFTLHYLE